MSLKAILYKLIKNDEEVRKLIKKDFTFDFVSQSGLDNKTKVFYAQNMLNNPLYDEIINKIKSDCMRLWETSPDQSIEDREQLYSHMKILKRIDAYFRRYVSDIVFDELADKLNAPAQKGGR